ncbi:putative Mitochondrial ATPase [Taphrina deformans PYCC 5710]|uniref:Mitochondrial ATPase n=1 Tax=Taphrina deformans (strain PYCC 5710 / ATCC 11124 / CBS 356.35 / IMI 108563 / JCM 9778 / NBRC 8474) TaxID=1097556 RepID=R4XAI9_TAPDE|nr:putative Mitochondrial ATPase [Taphrina deformans PYCC 5710]|eukprot:CCG82798.1 putative Mitochondrial ATPase [Taphrina deformans PYCC 5710]
MSRAPIQTAYEGLLKKGRLTSNPGQEALVNRLAQLQVSLGGQDQAQEETGLYIYGDVGTGKSRVADLFVSTLPENVTRRRIHFHEFMMDVHSRLHRARSRSGYSGDPLLRIGQEVRSESRVLCFDEFQVSDIADAMILKRLFGSIWASGGLMVSTSNRHPDKLYEKGLNRPLFVPFIKELQRRCEVWKMEGNQDYRMQTRGRQDERDQVFFTDEGAFNESLDSAVQGGQLLPMVIPVMMGRELRVNASRAKGHQRLVVSATFKGLCEKNLGTSDYYALSKKADIIYLTGVRQFKDDELDFVRRFITLCDIAYENRTRIVCLSDVPLFEVFQKIVPSEKPKNPHAAQESMEEMSVRKGGGSSSSMMSTFIGEMEWSATGLPASLASGGAGESDVKFAIGRAVSRLFEMGSHAYNVVD